MRLKSASRFLASVLMVRVLARPGSPSMRTCPLAKSAIRRRSITASWPMTDSPIRFFRSRIESRADMHTSRWDRNPGPGAVPGPATTALLLPALAQLPHHLVEVEARGLLPRRVLLETGEPIRHVGLRRDHREHAVGRPFV